MRCRIVSIVEETNQKHQLLGSIINIVGKKSYKKVSAIRCLSRRKLAKKALAMGYLFSLR